MFEHQTNLPLDTDYSTAPAVVPELCDEIARAWGLPLGESAEVRFLGITSSAMAGVFEMGDHRDL